MAIPGTTPRTLVTAQVPDFLLLVLSVSKSACSGVTEVLSNFDGLSMTDNRWANVHIRTKTDQHHWKDRRLLSQTLSRLDCMMRCENHARL